MTYDQNFIVWAAGFFDGEGNVDAKARNGSNGSPLARCRIANTDQRPIQLFKEAFGGSVGQFGKTNCYEWCVQGNELDRFVELILPYSVVKTEQLRLLVEFRKLMPGRGYRKISEIERWAERKRLSKLAGKIRDLKWVRNAV